MCDTPLTLIIVYVDLVQHFIEYTVLLVTGNVWYWWDIELIMKVEFEVILRPTVSRPVCLGVRRPSGTRDQFFFLLEISFRQLRVCYFVAPFLTRGRVCNLLYNCFWALPEQSLLGQVQQNSRPYFTVSFETPNLEGQVSVFISPRNRVAQLYPRALGSLYVASYDSQGSGGGILTRPHTGLIMKYNWSLYLLLLVRQNRSCCIHLGNVLLGYHGDEVNEPCPVYCCSCGKFPHVVGRVTLISIFIRVL
jgi:hypothetical protein